MMDNYLQRKNINTYFRHGNGPLQGYLRHGSRDSDGLYGVQFPAGKTFFLFSTASRPALGPTQPPIQWVPRALNRRVKQPGREADHLPPPSAKIRNAGAIPSLLHTS
jgi:hypothetical protein